MKRTHSLSSSAAKSAPHNCGFIKRGIAAGLLVCVLAGMVWADIQIKPQYEPNEPIVATVTITDVPEGAKLRGSFSVTDASYLPAGQDVFHIWAAPGKHVCTSQGVWVLTKDVTVEGQTFPVLLDFGQYNYVKEFVVGDGPDPPPPPPPPGTRWAVIWEETDGGRTPQQGNLYLALRKEFQDSRLRILDVTNLPPSLRALESQRPQNLQLPVLMVVARQPDGKTDKVVRTVALPSSVDAVKAEIAK